MNTLKKLQEHLHFPPVETTPGYFYKEPAPHITCADGTTMSVQASEFHYSTPCENVGPYTAVEVYFCGIVEAWSEYGDGDGDEPYTYLPIELVADEIDRRGGFK